MSKRKPIFWWSCIAPREEPYPFYTAYRRRDAIKARVDAYPKKMEMDWQKLRKKGFKCIRVHIVEAK